MKDDLMDTGLSIVQAHLEAGARFADAQQFEAAVAQFRLAAALLPDLPEAHYNLGIAWRRLGYLDNAIAAFQEAIALRPDWPEAHFNLGNTYAKSNRPALAIECYNMAVNQRPGYAKAERNLANVYRKLGRYAAATDVLERLYEASPSEVRRLRQESARLRGCTFTRDHLPRYNIGRWTYGKPEVLSWGQSATLVIGAFTSIAAGVKILLGGEHRTDWITTYPFHSLWQDGNCGLQPPESKGNVVIGNDVWLGTDAMILSGVTVGDGAVIGARCVVAKDIPPYAIAVGNPAQVVRKRFDDETISKLLAIAWWNWPDAKIEAYSPLLESSDIAGLLSQL